LPSFLESVKKTTLPMNGGRLSRKTTKHGSDGDPNLTKSTEKPPTRPKKQPPQG